MNSRKADTTQQKERLVWFFDNMNTEGKETLLKIAKAFVSTGEYSRNSEISEELKTAYDRLERNLIARMPEEF